MSDPQQTSGRPPRVLLAASGSVAAIKLPEIAAMLVHFAEVRVLLTAAARHFVKDEMLPAAVLPVYGAYLSMTQRHIVSGLRLGL